MTDLDLRLYASSVGNLADGASAVGVSCGSLVCFVGSRPPTCSAYI